MKHYLKAFFVLTIACAAFGEANAQTGDAAAGEAFHKSRGCASCHGELGISSNPMNPSVAGRTYGDVSRDLLDYKEGRRTDPKAAMMTNMAKLMSEADIANVSAYYATLKPAAGQPKEETAEKAADDGGKPQLPAELQTALPGDPQAGKAFHLGKGCAGCHGQEGISASPANPSVAGKPLAENAEALLAYREGRKTGGMAGMMANFAKVMSDKDIVDVSAYYASLNSGAKQQAAKPAAQPAAEKAKPEEMPVVKTVAPKEIKQQIARMLPGNVQAGAELHQKQCAACHGKDGIASMGANPSLAGQPIVVSAKELLDYRDGRRGTAGMALMMANAAKLLSDADIGNLAAYYASLPGAAQNAGDVPALVRKGDPERLITPCASCHGYDKAPRHDALVPRLQGQNPKYIAAALKEYRSGARNSDFFKEMRAFAKNLTDSEIDAVASYYGAPAAK